MSVLALERHSRVEQVCERADSMLRTLAELRALPCSHDSATSGQLRRTTNGYVAWLVCDACHADVRELGAVK